MCGLAGFFSSESINFDPHDTLRKMGNALSHRGPDDSGTLFTLDEKIALGHKRLSIIDLSKNAHQPMSDLTEDFSIIFNGEIYNFNKILSQI